MPYSKRYSRSFHSTPAVYLCPSVLRSADLVSMSMRMRKLSIAPIELCECDSDTLIGKFI